MTEIQNQLTDDIAIKNGSDFNKSIKIATLDGQIDNDELKALSIAYKENISWKIQITKKNLNQLKRSLNVWQNVWLWVAFKALNNKIDYNIEQKEIINTLKEFKDLPFDRKTNTPNLSAKAIFAIQWWLKELGYDTGRIDWQFGNNTKSALMKFQEKYNRDNKGAKVWINWQPWPKVIKALIKELEKVEEPKPVTEIPQAEEKVEEPKQVTELPQAEEKAEEPKPVTELPPLEESYSSMIRARHLEIYKNEVLTWITRLADNLSLSSSQIKTLFNSNELIKDEIIFSDIYNKWFTSKVLYHQYKDLFELGKSIGLRVKQNGNETLFYFIPQPKKNILDSLLTSEAKEKILSNDLNSYTKKIESLIKEKNTLKNARLALQFRIKQFFLDDLEQKADFNDEKPEDIKKLIEVLQELQKTYPIQLHHDKSVYDKIDSLIQKLTKELINHSKK